MHGITRCCLLVLLLGISSWTKGQHRSLLDEIAEQRSSSPPFAAEYVERLRLKGGSSKAPDGSWGTQDSDLTYVCSVDAKGSYIYTKSHKVGKYEVGDSHQFHDGKQFYQSLSGKSQGTVGQRSPGRINCASAGSEVYSVPISLFVAGAQLTQTGDRMLSWTSPAGTKYQVELVRIGKKAVISSVESVSAYGVSTFKVLEWLSYKDYPFPRLLRMQIRKGELEQERAYELVRLRPDLSKPLKWDHWAEGAIVKNTDSGAVFTYRDGKLVKDPRFAKDSSRKSVWRYFGVFACFVGIGAWVFWRTSKRRGQRSE